MCQHAFVSHDRWEILLWKTLLCPVCATFVPLCVCMCVCTCPKIVCVCELCVLNLISKTIVWFITIVCLTSYPLTHFLYLTFPCLGLCVCGFAFCYCVRPTYLQFLFLNKLSEYLPVAKYQLPGLVSYRLHLYCRLHLIRESDLDFFIVRGEVATCVATPFITRATDLWTSATFYREHVCNRSVNECHLL